jgi:hypothetical protein
MDIGSAFHEGLNLHSVSWVSDEVWKFLSHLELGQVELSIEVAPELELVWLSSQVGKLDLVHANGGHDLVSGEEALILGKVWSKTLLGENVLGNGQVVSVSNEAGEGGDVSLGDLALSNGVRDGGLESVLSVVLPDSLEMWLVRDPLAHLMWVLEVLHSDDLWAELVKGLVLLSEKLSSLLGGGVDTEDDLLILVSVGEGVKDLLWVVEMTVVSEPGWVWHLVVEESAGGSLTELLKSEPLDNVWLLSLSPELHWGPLRVEVSHSIVPSLSGVGINLPSVSVFGGSPVWNLESLEEGSWSSVEGDISNSLEKGIWMEILSEHMVHDVWLLVEFIAIEVLDSNSYIILKIN